MQKAQYQIEIARLRYSGQLLARGRNLDFAT
jgi:tetrahydromethanopterin S-methyltransferase subunit F